MKARTETVKRLTGWDMAVLERALRKLSGTTEIDPVSLDYLIEAVSTADSGKLTRRVATETGKDR